MRRLLVPLSLFGALAAVAGCYQPPAYVVPTSPPTATPFHAEAIATLSSGPPATQIAASVATSVTASPVSIVETSLDPGNVANSSVTVSNTSDKPVDMSGWILLVQNYRVTIPTSQYMTIAGGHQMTIYLNSSPTPTNGQNVYVGLESIQNVPRVDSDRTVLINPQGQVASTYPAAP
jgi:hypothetical protein